MGNNLVIRRRLLRPPALEGNVVNSNVNPYESPPVSAKVSDRTEYRSPRWIDWFVWTFPLLPVSSLYCTWLVAWLSLGRIPRVSLDDPKNIGIAVDILYLLTALLFLMLPLAATIGPLAQLTVGSRKRRTRVYYVAISIAVSVSAIVFLRFDPFGVLNWYID